MNQRKRIAKKTRRAYEWAYRPRYLTLWSGLSPFIPDELSEQWDEALAALKAHVVPGPYYAIVRPEYAA